MEVPVAEKGMQGVAAARMSRRCTYEAHVVKECPTTEDETSGLRLTRASCTRISNQE
jgi:hypothetical protein